MSSVLFQIHLYIFPHLPCIGLYASSFRNVCSSLQNTGLCLVSLILNEIPCNCSLSLSLPSSKPFPSSTVLFAVQFVFISQSFFRDWRDSTGGKAPAPQIWRPGFHLQKPCEKCQAWHILVIPVLGRKRLEGSWGLLAIPSSLINGFQDNEKPFHKEGRWGFLGCH